MRKRGNRSIKPVSICLQSTSSAGGEIETGYDRYVLKKRRKQLGLTLQEVASRAGIDIKQYQRFESGERELSGASFMTTLQVLRALEMDAEKYAAGEDEIKELIYRGHDNRLYNFETDEPLEQLSAED